MKHIRLAKKEDATAIALLGRTTFTETFGDLFNDIEGLRNYLNTTFSVTKIEKSIDKPNNKYWIAFVDRLPVGYAKLKLKSPSEFVNTQKISQLQKIYVLKDFLSMKIGRQLQDVLMNEARKIGAEQIWLSVYQDNQRAIAFYEKNGFEVVGSHKFSIGEDTFDFKAMSKQFVTAL
ncbi:GNAT family N-acetyltransferase [uncultured Croceitalea sp.]|uniref:GNAT family N-acetyltransferase n=1 Tax=uncultured Croceitalea sp. TaxID=1798908 RepID=UPI0033062761